MAKKLTNHCRLFLGAYDLTVGGLEGRFSGRYDALETTDWNETAPTHLLGLGRTEMEYSGLWDDAAGANEAGLRTLLGGALQVVTLHLGDTVADKAALTRARVSGLSTAPRLADLLPIAGEFRADQAPEYGLVLQPKVTKTATFNGPALDRGAGAAADLVWAYHVIAFTATGGNAKWTFTLQTDDNADFSTPATLDGPVDITAVGAARRVVGADAERYVRLVATRDATSGSLTYAGFST